MITVQRTTYRKGSVKGKVVESKIEGDVYVESDDPERRLPNGELLEQMPRYDSPICEELAQAGASNHELKICAEEEMLKYIYSNVQYPASARAAGYVGKTLLSFVVEKDGRITDVANARFTTATIDAEARRIVASISPWVPGYQRGKPVRVSFVLQINFDLK